ncbi:MAG: hypothetical protein LRY71_08685, partial [Bacillaceae bacterium]|nr:hypothetical protein [Bacillaceae bacterium]
GFAFRSSAHFLTANALPVSYTLPPLRRVRDFHPLVRCAAKRTINRHGFKCRFILYDDWWIILRL